MFKCTVNSNFHLIGSKTLLTNDFELTVPNLYVKLPQSMMDWAPVVVPVELSCGQAVH